MHVIDPGDKFPILPCLLVLGYFSWHSVGRSYVGIWFVFNKQRCIISEAVTLSR